MDWVAPGVWSLYIFGVRIISLVNDVATVPIRPKEC
jgi:hypothetical protein